MNFLRGQINAHVVQLKDEFLTTNQNEISSPNVSLFRTTKKVTFG